MSAIAVLVADANAAGAPPGAMEPRALDGVVVGYGFRCPGCGEAGFLALPEYGFREAWSVVSGDRTQPSTLTLAPSILDRGCGWHGYLRNGRWEPC